ncbi:MAG: EcsC family protein [Nitrospirales bacterium]|nr:EcsC family protein [Nitrospirales bacterium]
MENFAEKDERSLALAVVLLENPTFAAKVTDLIGAPVEKAITLLPDGMSEKLLSSTQKALAKALDLAVSTLDERYRGESADGAHRVLTSVSGALGGSLGLLALTVELPFSTTLMLRSIADIARSEGERITDVRAKLACLEVFAMGGTSSADDGAETGYFAIRAALAGAMTEAAKYLTQHGLSAAGAPAIVRFLSKIASRYSIQVSEKAAVQAIPLIGAAGGATINLLFMDHFQNMARGHFIVRRLERTYGVEPVREQYRRLATRP